MDGGFVGDSKAGIALFAMVALGLGFGMFL